MLDMLFLGVPFASLVGAGVFGLIPDEWFIHVFICSAILVTIGLFRQMRRFKYLTCETCGNRLDVDELVEGERITFTCDSCRIVWRTDFHHSTD